MWLALAAFACALCLQRIRSFDYWWHLRTGSLIAETWAVPRVDPYTFTVPGAPWIDIHWLFQLGLHGIHALGGHPGVVIAKTLLVLSLLAVIGSIGYRRERAWLSAAALALMLLVAADRFMPRPELPSFVLLGGVLALLDRFDRRGDRAVYWIVPIQLLWVNVHGLFALGIALCGIHLVGELLRGWVQPGSRIDRDRVRTLLTVTLASAAVCLLNPNGIDGALYPIQQLGMIGPPDDRGLFGSMIAELIPSIGGVRSPKPLATALLLTLAVASAAAMVANWRSLAASDALIWVAFGYLALGAQRNLALFALVAAPIAVRNANGALDRLALRGAGWQGTSRWAPVALAATLLVGTADAANGTLFPRLGPTREPGWGVMEALYPIGAAEWIARTAPTGPVAHHMADGGYLIWRLHEAYPVMSDGRLEVFGAETFMELQFPDAATFKALDDRYGFGVVLVHYSLVNSRDLLRSLYLNSNWRLGFVDDVAAVFVRVQPGDPAGLVDLDIDDERLFEPLSDEPGSDDLLRRLARTNFYTTMRRFERALELWATTVERYPDLPQGSRVHAALLHRNGLTAAAEAILRRALEESPGDPTLHSQVGDLHLETGDLEGARERYEEAIRIDPTLAYGYFRLAGLAERKGDFQDATQLYLRTIAISGPADPLAVAASQRLRAVRRRF